MIAGGDDPNQFVSQRPTDWFHNNGATYNRADDSVIISSRENFLICLDYNTTAIKWILGDPAKKWHQFPSLRQFALSVAPGSLAPIGQHAPSITFDQNLMVFDNGRASLVQNPPGNERNYASPRKYSLDLVGKVATEVWNFPMNQNVVCPFCSSIYEDAPYNYLIDYAIVNGGIPGAPTFGRFLGLDDGGENIFYYQYPTMGCNTAYNSIPIHLENTKFPTVGPQMLNLSTRGLVGTSDNVLIGGFIVTGTDPKSVVLRALGPSLSGFGISDVLADPVLNVYDSSGTLITSNDNWQADPNHFIVESNGLAPSNLLEPAMRAGGDDPSQFVYPSSSNYDWFHLNGATYNRADDSLIVSSRENFLICLDYETSAIKWILGDPTKKWYQFPSLRRFALTLAPGSRPPIGQHATQRGRPLGCYRGFDNGG